MTAVTLPGLVAFWDFQDDTLLSRGPAPIRLRAAGAPMETAPEGVFDVRDPQGAPGRNPFHYPGGLLKGDTDFTVGAVARPATIESDGRGGFVEKGGLIANPFIGLLGGLAIFNRALADTELAALAATPRPTHRGKDLPLIGDKASLSLNKLQTGLGCLRLIHW